jgi:hypothetical protein
MLALVAQVFERHGITIHCGHIGSDADGLIEDHRVMVRPLSAVLALRDAVFAQLPATP